MMVHIEGTPEIFLFMCTAQIRAEEANGLLQAEESSASNSAEQQSDIGVADATNAEYPSDNVTEDIVSLVPIDTENSVVMPEVATY